MTRHREQGHRSCLETPYSTVQPPLRKSSKLSAMTLISSNKDSDPPDLDENGTDTQLDNTNNPHDDPEHTPRSWVLQPEHPLYYGPDAGDSDTGTSSSSDGNDNETVEDGMGDGQDQDNDYPEWDEFELYPEGTAPAVDFLREGYEQEAASIGMS